MIENNTTKSVYIEWVDSKGITYQWEYLDEIEPLKPCICKSIGYLVDDNDDYKTITQTISDTQIAGRMTIPTKAIIKMKEIRGVPK